MSWTTLGTAATWHVTDKELTNAAQYRLLENAGATAGAAWFTSMFTTTQFLNALNQRQQMFLKDTGAIVTRATQGATPQQQRYPLPPDWIATVRLTFQPVDDSKYSLVRTDAYQLDQGMSDWNYTYDAPFCFQESTLPTLQVEIAKPPNDAGDLGLLYVALPTTLDGSGIALSIPDEFAPYVLYGALADLLGQDGEGKDLKRANYCQQRYAMGVELAKAMLQGAKAQ